MALIQLQNVETKDIHLLLCITDLNAEILDMLEEVGYDTTGYVVGSSSVKKDGIVLFTRVTL
jgi:hypothetical protein